MTGARGRGSWTGGSGRGTGGPGEARALVKGTDQVDEPAASPVDRSSCPLGLTIVLADRRIANRKGHGVRGAVSCCRWDADSHLNEKVGRCVYDQFLIGYYYTILTLYTVNVAYIVNNAHVLCIGCTWRAV